MYESIINNSSLIATFPRVPFCFMNNFTNVLTGGLLVVNWLYPFYNFQNLPRYIALLYNINGKVLLAGSKFLLFALPLAGTLLWAKIHKWSQNPESLNYPFKRTNKNYLKAHDWARGFLKVTGLFSQLLVFANNALILNGQTTDGITRSKWIRNGVIGFVLAAAAAFGGLAYILDEYVLDKEANATEE